MSDGYVSRGTKFEIVAEWANGGEHMLGWGLGQGIVAHVPVDLRQSGRLVK